MMLQRYRSSCFNKLLKSLHVDFWWGINANNARTKNNFSANERKYTQIKNNLFCSNGRVGTFFYPRIVCPFPRGQKACPPYEALFILKSFYLRSFACICGKIFLMFLTVRKVSIMPAHQILQNQHQSLIVEECLANIQVDRTFATVGSTKSKI